MFGRMYSPFYGPMYGHHPFLGFFFALAVVGIVVGVLYILTLRRALLLCAPHNRAASPDSAWLLLIPLFNIIWQFVLYPRISVSLEREFRQRGLPVEHDPARSLGLALAILHACSIIPLVNLFTGIAALVCFVLYWIKISGYSRQLEANSASAPASAASGQWSSQSQVQGSLCSHCGTPLQSGTPFCAHCGAPVPQ
jgi:hypothetical protein